MKLLTVCIVLIAVMRGGLSTNQNYEHLNHFYYLWTKREWQKVVWASVRPALTLSLTRRIIDQFRRFSLDPKWTLKDFVSL